jgi:aerobic carbon-monoxide dehydrogenase small subunit
VLLSEGASATVRFTVNGRPQSVTSHPLRRLLDVLREDLRLTGTKEGCGEGECGACAVLFDGEVVNSCLVPILQAQDATIVTIEGLAQNEKAALLQEAFIQCGGAQCGICTPGMIVASWNLLERDPLPTEQDLRNALSGNLCRCTGYTRIFEAVRTASGRLQAARK